MEIKDISLGIIIVIPIAILLLEFSFYGIQVWWKWFIQNYEE